MNPRAGAAASNPTETGGSTMRAQPASPPTNYQSVLDDITTRFAALLGTEGKVAHYIPALARVPARQFGIALRTREGVEAAVGDCDTPFSIQSISKLFSLTLALRRLDDALCQRIGREPSGNLFDSLVQLEAEHGVPRNPFINAGAIAVADRLLALGMGKHDVLALAGHLCGEAVAFDAEVAASEAATGFRNLALANFMKSFGKLHHAVADVLDVYFHQCAIAMTCRQLARAAAGEFAFCIGLPCKSGVGGGIVAVVPDTLTLCVWSPALDATGNSAIGRRALELFAARAGLSVF